MKQVKSESSRESGGIVFILVLRRIVTNTANILNFLIGPKIQKVNS